MGCERLRIGRIPYANLFPIFHTLETECDCSSYEFVEGVPSKLNRMLRDGEIDVSPSSSIEYLRNPELYDIIEGHSISSKGPVGSILFFTDKPLDELRCSSVLASAQSETSVALLEIVLRRFCRTGCAVQVAERPEALNELPFLLIGDDALKCRSRESEDNHGRPLVYDLGDIWFKRTGLPFVFALWIVRKVFNREEPATQAKAFEEKRGLVRRFISDLNKAKTRALRNLTEIAKCAPARSFMSEEDILKYWDKLDYDLNAEHKKGLDLFNSYLKEPV